MIFGSYDMLKYSTPNPHLPENAQGDPKHPVYEFSTARLAAPLFFVSAFETKKEKTRSRIKKKIILTTQVSNH